MKIQNLNKLNSSIKTIPKDLLGTAKEGVSNSLLEKVPKASENIHYYESLMENIGRTEELEAIEGIASSSSNIGEHLHSLGSQIPLLSIALKSIEPIRDFQNGRYKSALVKGGVRTTESLTVLPFKLAWAALGGGLGILKQAFGIQSESSGFKNGFLSNNKKWIGVRSGIEQFLINPYTFFNNLAHPISEKIIETSDRVDSIMHKRIEQNIEYAKEKTLLNINYIYDDMTKVLKQAELKINTLLGNSLEIKPVPQEEIEVIYQGYDTNTSKAKIEAIKEQQAFFQKSYENYMLQFQSLLNDKLFADSEQGDIIKRIINTIQTFYENNIGPNKENIEKIAKILAANQSIVHKLKKPDFNKIAGYSDIKQELTDSFIKPIKKFNAGKNVQLPNLILLYGPQGCGKTFFSNALVEETKCNVIELDLCRNEDENVAKLKESINKANQIYKKDNVYSIIRIDELDILLNDKTKKILADIDLNTISKNNFCTIVATTNYPKNVNKNLIPSIGFQPIYIPPANNSNIQEILRFYFNDIENIKPYDINYRQIADYIITSASPNSYSNARIAKILQRILIEHNSDVTDDIIKKYFKESQPDIEQKIIDQYRKDVL